MKQMLFHPQRTTRAVVQGETQARKSTQRLALLGGLFWVLHSSVLNDILALHYVYAPIKILTVVFFGLLFGTIGVSILAHCQHGSSRMFGGKADYQDVRTAVIWSMVPVVYCLPLTVLAMASYFLGLQYETIPSLEGTVSFIAALWSGFLYIGAIATVENFSILKAILSTIVTMILIIVLMFALLIVYSIAFN